MTVSELKALISAESLTPSVQEDAEVTCGYTGDLLSWVMAHAEAGMAWVTVQTNMNVPAVAVLQEMACIILPDDIHPEQEILAKAAQQGMPVLVSPLTAYEICGRMAASGIPAHS